MNKFVNTKPIRLIELFAGIGSQAKALQNLGVNFEHYRVCEFDKYAIMSYNAVHGTNFETSDVTKITAEDLGITDTEQYTYLLTYSFPCQDLSNAGLGRGMEKGSGTRSGLLWEVERLLNESSELPQLLLMENVPQVHGKKNIEHFNKWIEFLESKGYSNHWQDLNAKDYGIPQNRNRCFMVSILGDYTYSFPKAIPLTLRLGDMLEAEVDEKYYLSDKGTNGLLNAFVDGRIHKPKLFTGEEDSISTIDTRVGAQTHRGQYIEVKEATKKGCAQAYPGGSINLDYPNSQTRRGRVGKNVAQTLTTSCNQTVVEPVVCEQRKDEGLRFFKGGCVGTLRTIDACGDKRVIVPRDGGTVGNDWIDKVGEFVCSVCGEPSEYVSKFCPECGARMNVWNN